MPAPFVLSARSVTKNFGSNRALDGVDFDLRAGEIHALLGENGAGKSTLMNILRGRIRPTSGSVFVRGELVRLGSPRDAARLGIGMVHQHFLLVPVFTVLENLTLALPGRTLLDPQRVAEKAGVICEKLGWRIAMNARIADLAVGTQQRVEILRTLLSDARILLFDEPTAVLAPAEIDELFGVLRILRSQGASIVFVSHKLQEVVSLCDRVTVLTRGRVSGVVDAADTSPADLARRMVGPDDRRRADEPLSERAPAAVEGAPALRVSNLSTTRRHKDEVALERISFTIGPGEVLGIAGVDGNGQTELFEALSGIRKPSSGNLIRPPRDSVGLIPPDRRRQGLALDLSVAENLVLDAAPMSRYRVGPFLKRRLLRELAVKLAADFDIRATDLNLPATALSGGNQQKIVVARALWRSPRLLIAVSPTRGLDVAATAYVHGQLMRSRSAGAGIVLISTELDEIYALSTKIAVLYEGRIAGFADPSASREELGLMMGGKTSNITG